MPAFLSKLYGPSLWQSIIHGYYVVIGSRGILLHYVSCPDLFYAAEEIKVNIFFVVLDPGHFLTSPISFRFLPGSQNRFYQSP